MSEPDTSTRPRDETGRRETPDQAETQPIDLVGGGDPETLSDAASTVQHLSTALIVVDCDLLVRRWNRQAEEVFRKSAADAMGDRIDEVLPFLREIGLDRQLYRVFQHGRTVSMLETPINLDRALSGDNFWYEEDSTKVRSRTGRLLTPGRAPDGSKLDYLDFIIDPLTDGTGAVSGAAITIRSSTERALLRLNYGLKTELLEMIYQVSNALRTTESMESSLFIILSALTARQGGAFDRAMLFLVDDLETTAEGWMGMGSLELFDVWSLWRRLAEDRANLDTVLRDVVPDVLEELHDLTDDLRQIKIPLDGDGVVATAMRTRTTFTDTELPAGCTLEAQLAEKLNVHRYVAIPLVAHREVNGLLLLDYTAQPPALTADWLGLLEMYAHQAALAIENSRAYHRAVKQSQTDALTGLSNHGFFQATLARAVAQAGRYAHPVSLIMLDLDRFKQLNDKYLHQVGDRVLQELGRVIRKSVREVDIPARYGGEEFVVILPHTPRHEALRLAERIRQNVEADLRVNVVGGEQVGVTASFGVASCPGDADTAEELIRAADKALYAAKEGGRNRVMAAEPDEPEDAGDGM